MRVSGYLINISIIITICVTLKMITYKNNKLYNLKI